MKSFLATLAFCGLELTLNTPICTATEWKPVNTDEESKSTTSNHVDSSESTQWSPIQSQPETSTKKNQKVVWTPVEASSELAPSQSSWTNLDDDIKKKNQILWEPIEPAIAQDIEENMNNGKSIKETSVRNVAIRFPQMPSGTTFANDKAIWRDDTWHPQISGTVPVGFGPSGWMVSGSLWAMDCVTGAGYCTTPESWDDYRKSIETLGDANFNVSLGIGDAEKLVGLTITGRFEETAIQVGDRNSEEVNPRNLLSNYYIGAHLSRNLSPDTAIKIGIDNWLDVRDCDFCGFPKNAYAVVSQRFRIRENQFSFLPNAYLTLGVGNGQFRPLDELIRASVSEQRAAGCITAGFTPDKPCSQEALQRATWKANSYGRFEPIGALAIEAFPGMNLIGEWTGRNLNTGFSVRPFEEFGLILTGMWENILPNCDYGCTVRGIPDYPQGIDLNLLPSALTERPRFSFQISLEAKF